MYLKSIDMQGFKSFANKIKLEFAPGLTGIVGPNGSGKSNIADAVRWVLGEQSAKQLRGTSMQDVIFSGTENRKPVSFAYVCLTFDNKDGRLAGAPEEVSVARRVYRSGESEYLMNGAPCRMRDILELFYDTGIGREGYSIIGQGQVEKILNGKPEDRREMFDEAAGIVRFRKRREATRKKLESEQGSLTRVNDIISELERQVKPLEKQSEKARRYLKYKEELKGYDIQDFKIENAKNSEQLTQIETHLDTVTSELETAQEGAAALRESYEGVIEVLEKLESDLERTRGDRDRAATRVETLEGNVRVIEEQIRSRETSEAQVGARKEQLANDKAAKRLEQEKYRAEKNELNKKLDGIDDRISGAREKLREEEKSLGRMKTALSKKQQSMIDIMSRKADEGAQRQHYDTLRTETMERKIKLDADLEDAKTRQSSESEVVREWQAKLEMVETVLAQLQTDAEKNAAEVVAAGKAVADANDAYMKARDRANTLSISLDNLRNLAERYEGFGGSVRKLMEAKHEFPGMIGTVADLISTDSMYETAIETALGGSLQNVVTDTEGTAKGCIAYLKKGHHGRATFLPLDAINPRTLSRREALRERGVLGVASDLVQVEGRYTTLAEHLLGAVVVCDNIDNALALARKYRHDLRIVTLDGESLNRGGSISGGAFRNNSNLLGRTREIDELTASRDKAVAIREQMKQALDEASEKHQSLKKERARIGTQKDETDKECVSIAAGLDAAEKRYESICGIVESLQEELDEINDRLSELATQGGAADETVKQSDADKTDLETEIAELTQEIRTQETKCDELRKKTEDLNVEFSTLSEKDANVLENLTRIRRELEKLDAENADLSSEGSKYFNETVELKTRIEMAKGEIVDERRKLESLNASVKDLNEKREASARDQNRFVEERDTLNGNITRLTEEQVRLENQKEKTEEKLERAMAYLWDEYELTPSEIEGMGIDEELSPVELKKRISGIRSGIKELGSVNVNAIDEYKEVAERYHFMKGQQEDLFKAEAELRKVIEELDQGMRKQFTEKFAQIQVEFDKVFRELFGGGRASLSLVESEDVLDAGIEINAQPPGKKLSNMMQMSGGEKALTAISILFAIQNLKPSPFCLLDEIEASLDDSNVQRFAEYINKLGDQSQFITITHRRGTMTAAERLYGITMQEKGVSTLVSVDLT